MTKTDTAKILDKISTQLGYNIYIFISLYPQSTIEWKCSIFYTPRIRNDEIKNNNVMREW